jgi:type VII secretion integral membrane protein EccD
VLAASGGPAAAVAAGLLAAAALGGSVAAGARGRDRALVLLLGLAGCGLSALAAALGTASTVDLSARPVLAGGLAVAASAAVLLAARSGPAVPFGVLGAAGLLAATAQWLHLAAGLAPVRVAGLLCAVLLGGLVFAPRLAIRFARIRGPQLPRTAEELQGDVEPVPATEMSARTAAADGFLTVAVVGAAIVFGCSFPFLIGESVPSTVLAMLVAVAALLRARTFFGAWQRVSLATAGGFGLALGVLVIAHGRWAAALAALGLAFGVSLLAMLRPPGRRLLPIWGHLANGLETLSAAAVLPVLLQLFGAYALARGLVG